MVKFIVFLLIVNSFYCNSQNQVTKGEYWILKNSNARMKNDTIPFNEIYFYNLNGSCTIEKSDSLFLSENNINSDTLKLSSVNKLSFFPKEATFEYLKFKKINKEEVVIFIPISETYIKEYEYIIKHSKNPLDPNN